MDDGGDLEEDDPEPKSKKDREKALQRAAKIREEMEQRREEERFAARLEGESNLPIDVQDDDIELFESDEDEDNDVPLVRWKTAFPGMLKRRTAEKARDLGKIEKILDREDLFGTGKGSDKKKSKVRIGAMSVSCRSAIDCARRLVPLHSPPPIVLRAALATDHQGHAEDKATYASTRPSRPRGAR